jgi:hypothetical protein
METVCTIDGERDRFEESMCVRKQKGERQGADVHYKNGACATMHAALKKKRWYVLKQKENKREVEGGIG